MCGKGPTVSSVAPLNRVLLDYRAAGLAAGLTKSPLYLAAKNGTFPLPVKIGKRSLLPSDEAEAMVSARVAGMGDDAIRALVHRLHDARRRLGATT